MNTPNPTHIPYWSKDSKAYTPLGIRNLFAKAVEEQNGDIQAVLDNKQKYKPLVELWHAGFLALALKKWIHRKFVLYPSDSPDVHFLDQEKGEGISVEIAELYQYMEDFDGNYNRLAKHLHKAKGEINLPVSHLLVISRIKHPDFNVSIFCREIQQLKWYFERIWFCVYTASMKQWTFFDIYPAAQFNDSNYISFNLEKDKSLWY